MSRPSKIRPLNIVVLLIAGIFSHLIYAEEAEEEEPYQESTGVLCKKSKENGWAGYNSLDAVIGSFENIDSQGKLQYHLKEQKSLKDSIQEIVNYLSVHNSYLANSFLFFINNSPYYPTWNFSSQSSTREWKSVTNAKLLLKTTQDTHSFKLPGNCLAENNKGNFFNLIIKKEEGFGREPYKTSKLVYYYDDKILKDLSAKPLQLSLALVHIWLTDFTSESSPIRQLNYFLHSKEKFDSSSSLDHFLKKKSMDEFSNKLAGPYFSFYYVDRQQKYFPDYHVCRNHLNEEGLNLIANDDADCADFEGQNLSGTSSSRALIEEQRVIRGASFKNTNLSSLKLPYHMYLATNFEGANLSNANLKQSLFAIVKFRNTNFTGADISYTVRNEIQRSDDFDPKNRNLFLSNFQTLFEENLRHRPHSSDIAKAEYIPEHCYNEIQNGLDYLPHYTLLRQQEYWWKFDPYGEHFKSNRVIRQLKRNALPGMIQTDGKVHFNSYLKDHILLRWAEQKSRLSRYIQDTKDWLEEVCLLEGRVPRVQNAEIKSTNCKVDTITYYNKVVQFCELEGKMPCVH